MRYAVVIEKADSNYIDGLQAGGLVPPPTSIAKYVET
ncbi:MAG: hypothetical protein JWR80_2578 [Bradyrhizobium sp.]|nr:hypothetical protein [Bradyrhizobium sp.]